MIVQNVTPKKEAALFYAVVFMTCFSSLAQAEEVYTLTIKDHQFSPAEITVPAHQKIKLTVDNQDATPEEFESYELRREKVVSGHSKITLFLGPLQPGRYTYFGEFHKDTAVGTIVAKESAA